MSDGSPQGESDPTRSKVGRLIEEYGMVGVREELPDRWLGRGVDSQSLRSLADWFNERLVAKRLEEAGESPLDGEPANTYRLLTDDDVGAGARVDAETALERAGIDPGNLQREFVSHQAVHTYLREYRDVSKERNDENPHKRARTTVQRLRNRLIAVVGNSLSSLADRDELVLGDFDVLVDIQVFCEDCGTAVPVTELLDEGGCSCRHEE